ncbi:hypothetical protein [Deinococcus xianganensis]|jgi:hypothetical protein|uniref:Uncharacterized protein n=1 Tax=Deinococcus xianganensis TaxID=1507289 RepID=A0A6I4YT62_9DEIO|nr:hypothetical protein [Deinococcus xianganensis]MXV20805.1 hypothetical protein [Deinococcus xianganensis]
MNHPTTLATELELIYVGTGSAAPWQEPDWNAVQAALVGQYGVHSATFVVRPPAAPDECFRTYDVTLLVDAPAFATEGSWDQISAALREAGEEVTGARVLQDVLSDEGGLAEFLEDVLDPVLGRDYLVDASGQRITAVPEQVA